MTGKSKIFALSFSVLGMIAAGLLGYAVFIEPNKLVITEKTIRIDGWNKALDGLKIVAISDIHGGSSFITEQKIRDVVRLSNLQDPDLVVLLGDFVSQERANKPVAERELKMPMAVVAANLKGLTSKYGIYAVLGNHDGWYSDRKVADALGDVGFTVLQNRVDSVEINGEMLRILGLIDHASIPRWSTFGDEIRELIDRSGGNGNIIALEHSPDVAPLVMGNNLVSPELKLFLAGHTHGGQVSFPLIGAPIVPSSYGKKYVSGHIKEDDIDIFVTTGVGTSILPVRFLVPPEIAVLTIRSD